ncbi:hypothetical protein OCAE111667_18700 [Occultella aeris]|uniref:Uncharacterized protein n=1 Tax=Occultella aeris TaxID=2761496 RepID=A0A7M4DJ77_9MICO|nr:hypothetical protein HALOF300_02183 [Occultella aeris]
MKALSPAKDERPTAGAVGRSWWAPQGRFDLDQSAEPADRAESTVAGVWAETGEA